VGHPAEAPAVAVDRNGSSVIVYASWNGATEVTRWEVLAGGAASGSVERQVAASPRTGFETIIEVKGLASGDSNLAVRALDATGAVLGASNPIAVPT
jgi:hypothetical protein